MDNKYLNNILQRKKNILVITGFNYLEDSSGTSKVVKSHELLFQESGYDYICIYPLIWAYRLGITLTGVYGVSVNGHSCGFVGLNNLKYLLTRGERTGHRLAGILIHHAIFNRLDLLGDFLHQFSKTKKVFYLHDYWTCCLSINMMPSKERNTWCHSDMRSGCVGCVWQERNQQHREAVREFFTQVGECEFIAPSQSVATEWQLRNPLGVRHVRVIEHLKSKKNVQRSEKATTPVRVAFIGAPNVNKGWPDFERIANRCQGSVKLYHMGHTDLRLPGVENVDVQIHKQGLNAMVKAISSKQIDIALLLSGWLETYSYTLFESLQAKALVCCFDDSGNVSDVIRKTGLGWSFRDEDALVDFLNSKALLSEIQAKQRAVVFPQEMVTNDEIVSCFSDDCPGLGTDVLSSRYSVIEALKTMLTATGIESFNTLKAVLKVLLRKECMWK